MPSLKQIKKFYPYLWLFSDILYVRRAQSIYTTVRLFYCGSERSSETEFMKVNILCDKLQFYEHESTTHEHLSFLKLLHLFRLLYHPTVCNEFKNASIDFTHEKSSYVHQVFELRTVFDCESFTSRRFTPVYPVVLRRSSIANAQSKWPITLFSDPKQRIKHT